MKLIYAALLLILPAACNTKENSVDNNVKDTVVLTPDKIAAERQTVNPRPVKSYAETVKSFETTDKFRVDLYETKATFKYLIKISYKGMQVNDTLRVPNFGMLPAVDIVKGNTVRPSCIVGFLDKEKQFKESKLIAFQADKLKVRVLKHYAVYQSE